MPREVAQPVATAYGLKVLPLTDRWAQRGFTICFLDEKQLSPAAKLLLSHLEGLASARSRRPMRNKISSAVVS
jgi:hypothetical protein